MNTRICVTPENLDIIPSHFRDDDGRYSLDLTADSSSKLALSFQDDWDITGEINKTAVNRNYPLTIPATLKNNLLLGHLADENIINSQFLQNGYLLAQIVKDGAVGLDGVLIVNDDETKDGKAISYEIIVLGKEKFWISTLQNTYLHELTFDTVLFNRANVLSIIQSVTKYDTSHYYAFAPIFHGRLKNQAYGDLTTYNNWVAEDMSIVLFARYVFELIEQALEGWAFVSKLIDSEKFKHLSLHILENLRQTEENINLNKFKLIMLTRKSIGSLTSNYGSFRVKYDDEEYDENELNTLSTFDNQNDYQSVMKLDGLYAIISNAVFRIEAFNIGVSFGYTSDFEIYKNGVLIHSNTVSGSSVGNPNIEHSANISHAFQVDIQLKEDDILTYKVNVQVGNLSGGTSLSFYHHETSTFRVELLKDIFDTEVNPSQFINPSITCWDLFEDILMLHGCKLRTDYERKEIYFDPPADFYKQNSEAKDWTDKVGGMSRNREFANSVQYYNFLYANDSGDKYYNATKNGGRTALYDYTYDFLTDFKGERFNGKEEVKLKVLAASRMLKVATDTDVVCVTENEIIGGDSDRLSSFYLIEEEAERTYKFSPRLLYYKGMGAYGSGTTWTFEGVMYSEIPILQIINRYDNSDEYRLDWAYFFENNWKKYVQNLNFNGIISTYAILNLLDVMNFDTRYKIFIAPNFYYLKLIEHWLIEKPYEPTSIKLLRAG